ncbi:TonB-dependent receptor plug domain-containing protein [Sphingomonas sp. MAH-20]|uniref:TonB-dependent receptor plug domain-containing protein n=1 Tax=Sphingomonas horti TaxID=2682842 RepID=A0A6I4J5P6_9SPHN|nr:MULTISPECIES: carboxypeptidase regulatory-like domain-containing protein [Sphingomonas]MBA2921202.1 carboxypeptidase regulatory-like domain-containing protein [Sphingomonas sp. CGMCC 1.13658]MVO79443.1 TonB-dependent receptor plug domain-containing protein [Sphingomonas horti]
MRNHLFIGAAIAALVAPAAVQAQETTSTIRGTVTDNGAPVAGATVTAVHVPSGTRSTTTTDASGAFTLPGLRVGGPFTVSINGNQAQVTDVFTVIGTPFNLPLDLAVLSGQNAGEEIVVTASSVARAGNVSQGPATVLTATQIQTVATINRDIRDLSVRDPFARLDDTPSGGRAVSFAGQNARYNRFTVDGVPITDNFGLNPDSLPTRRSPIPLDAIGQFQARVAPYDVREGNFQGGVINAILKSGTNEFHGTGFYSYNSDKLTGDQTKSLHVNLPKFKSENYGAEISGPIIKDKLFFMVAGERVRAGTPIPEGPIDNNAGAPIPGLTQAIVDQISQIAKQRFNYDTGGVLNNSDDKDDRLVARLDANLSDSQRASLTYSYTKDSIKFNQNSFVTPPPGLGLESNGYVASNRLHFGVFSLNSDWSDNFSTEVRAFYKDYKRGQDPILGRGFAQVRVCAAATSDRPGTGTDTGTNLSTSCPSGVPIVSFGPDVSRQTNELTSNTFGTLVQARLKAEDHDLRLFGEFQTTNIFNAFLQRSAGDYYFDSIADLQAGNAQRYQYANAVPSLDPDDAAAKFNYQLYTFGLQDNWRLTDTLNLLLGVRYDLYGGSPNPTLNPNFVKRYGFVNNAYISGRGLFQPRFGFDWKPTSRIAIRGGAGVFGGGTPDVYVSNSFSNTGILTNQIDVRQANNGAFTGTGVNATNGAAILQGVNPATIPGAANDLLSAASVSTTGTTNALDPNFKLPSQLRATLSGDYTADLGFMGDEWRFGLDFFYSKVRNQVFFTDIRSVQSGLLTPDGRPRYVPVTLNANGTRNFNDTGTDILLTNTGKGRAYVAVARFDKSWDFGLNIYGSFTYQDVKDQTPATSSTAGSNYLNGAFFDPNRAQYATSNDEVKYIFKYGLTFDHAFFGDYKTRVALFGQTRIGHPFSYTFTDPSGGRSPVFGTTGSGTNGTSGSRYLLYVPKIGGDPLVTYDSAATQSAFEAFINSNGLKNFQGKVAPRNAFNSRWYTKIDLHVEQEIPTFIGDSRVTLFADIENVGNLINKDWGQIQEFAFPYTVPVIQVQCLTTPGGAVATNSGQACAQYRYSSFNNPKATVYSKQSLYAIRVGARFTF